MLDFTPPTIEYAEAVHRRDIEIAEAQRQVNAIQRKSNINILQRIMNFFWSMLSKIDDSELEQADLPQQELIQQTQNH